MKRTMITGTLAAVLAFSATTFAAVEAVKERGSSKVDTMKDKAALQKMIQPTVDSSKLKFTTAKPAAQGENAPVCSREELATQLIKDTRISYADALAALKFWSGHVSVGTCHGDAGGLIGYGAEARENFLTAAIDGMNKMQGKSYSAALAAETWSNSIATALNEDVATASATVKQLASPAPQGCGILAL